MGMTDPATLIFRWGDLAGTSLLRAARSQDPVVKPNPLHPQTLDSPIIQHMEIAERFWAKVDKTSACWLWTAACDRGGYGEFTIGDKNLRAHRVAWFLTYGKWPSRALDHECEIRHCVRPGDGHTRVMVTRENILRSRTNPVAVNARKTHCNHGHEYTPENTGYTTHKGHEGRFCRRCAAYSPAKYRKQKSRLIAKNSVTA
jgi:hypothetical protein